MIGMLAGPASLLWAAEASGPPREAADLRASWHLLESGQYRRAEAAFTQAVKRSADQSAAWVGLGLSQFWQSKDDLALTSLTQALRLDAGSALAHRVVGVIHYHQGRLSQAIDHYEAAARLDPHDVAVQDQLQMAQREYQAEAGLDRLFSVHFVVKFPPASRDLANRVAELLETIYQDVGAKLDYFPSDPLTVQLYHEPEFRAVTLSPSWVHGVFDGIIHLAVEAIEREPGQARRLLAHEYTHAAVHRLSSGRAPVWLQEGLALVFEGGPQVRSPGPSAFLAGHAEGGDPLAGSSSGFVHQSFLALTPHQARAAYLQSHAATQALIDRYGLGPVRRLLERLSIEPDFARVFDAVLGERYRGFEAVWTTPVARERF